MKYKAQLLQMMEEDYEAFIKALLSIELKIEDSAVLEELYEDYMLNDSLRLLDSFFYPEEGIY